MNDIRLLRQTDCHPARSREHDALLPNECLPCCNHFCSDNRSIDVNAWLKCMWINLGGGRLPHLFVSQSSIGLVASKGCPMVYRRTSLWSAVLIGAVYLHKESKFERPCIGSRCSCIVCCTSERDIRNCRHNRVN